MLLGSKWQGCGAGAVQQCLDAAMAQGIKLVSFRIRPSRHTHTQPPIPPPHTTGWAQPPHVQYIGSSFWPSVIEMDVPAVLKLRTYSRR